jgi:hypothetical protein
LTHQVDERAKPPGLLITEHADTISIETLNHRGNYGFDNWDVESGRERRSEARHISVARAEPVVDVRATQGCLHYLECKHNVHYIRTVRVERDGGEILHAK